MPYIGLSLAIYFYLFESVGGECLGPEKGAAHTLYSGLYDKEGTIQSADCLFLLI